ncbi:MAG TPA: homoserine dehydrogenase [Candidatus Binatia bacterium]|nr:homoserine dehydrogenase [Candidatus Binatia bacterium]
MPRPISIGLLGLGTVGTGVVKLLDRNQATIRKRLGRGLRVAAVAVRHAARKRDVTIDRALISTDARRLIADPGIDIVVELIGGIEPAKSLVLGAMAAGKDVVTANKALLALHGQEVFQAAERAGVRLGFEASVAGGVPIIRVLRQALAGDRNRAIHGIVNGTCNSILTAMTDRGAEFSEALAQAQAAGLAEADPSLDIDGTDAAQKLSLLVALSFGARCPVDSIHTEGIRRVGQLDVGFARELGYVIKLLAIAKDEGKAIEARVHPTMIPRTSLLADVRGASNAVHVQGEALGPTMYVGEGAGMLPTATSVVGDIVDAAQARIRQDGGPQAPLGMPWRELRRARIRPIGTLECEYYLRFLVLDRPGVLGRIAGILGRHQISIASVIQKDRKRGTSVPIVIRTHDALEKNLRGALDEIGKLPVTSGKPVFVRIEDRL